MTINPATGAGTAAATVGRVVHSLALPSFKRTSALLSINLFNTAAGNKASTAPVISADGRFVVFSSDANDLSAILDDNEGTDLYLRDLVDGDTRWITVDPSGLAPARYSYPGANQWPMEPVISADGRYIAFMSVATNLVGITSLFHEHQWRGGVHHRFAQCRPDPRHQQLG